MKFKKNQVHIILHACPWSVKYILVGNIYLITSWEKKILMMEVRKIRKHTHTHLNTTSDGETDGTEQSSPNIWVQMWGRQLEPIPKSYLSLTKASWWVLETFPLTFKTQSSWTTNPGSSSRGVWNLGPNHLPHVQHDWRWDIVPTWKIKRTFLETEWTLPKLSSRTAKGKQNFDECVVRILTIVSGPDIN